LGTGLSLVNPLFIGVAGSAFGASDVLGDGALSGRGKSVQGKEGKHKKRQIKYEEDSNKEGQADGNEGQVER
jgi:hypothetical protein